MERFVCIHGHFYQPPRENPWLEAVETEDSAYPYHDWNERVTAECYAPNYASRILDAGNRIEQIVNNYSKISFNFGPTLLSWLEENARDVYDAVIEADRQSLKNFSGHGSALGQPYNHMILPLANRRDKITQVRWGLADFEHRFGRKPEGMWLPETAADLETLDILAEHGLRFTVMAQHQAARFREAGAEDWRELKNGNIDPTLPYLLNLPTGRKIAIFFYDGPISRAVAFERLLGKGEDFANRLLGAFSDERPWPQLVHIATDGETYGHHHRYGDMALAYAAHYLEANKLARLTNYGEFLEKHPPTREVEIRENTSWSCVHGVARWADNCGCSTGAHAGWSQAWRVPLRQALDFLRDTLAPRYEKEAGALLKDPWAARDDYVSAVLDRTTAGVDRFLGRHAAHPLEGAERTRALKLLELQRHAQLMYTSCGWFFDDLSGIETLQVLRYAARVVQLAHETVGDALEESFLGILERARSNIAEHGDGRAVFEKLVRPSMIGLRRVGAHYAVSALFDSNGARKSVYCYGVERQDFRLQTVGVARLGVGCARITSKITGESARLCFGVLHLGDQNLVASVQEFADEDAYRRLAAEVPRAFSRGELAEAQRVLEKNLGSATYSLRDLFRDEQRRVLDLILAGAMEEAEGIYRQVYEHRAPLMRFMQAEKIPIPKAFQAAAEVVLNRGLGRAFEAEELDPARVADLLESARLDRVELDAGGLAYAINRVINRACDRLRSQPNDLNALLRLKALVDLATSMPFEVDLWMAQNVVYEILRTAGPRLAEAAERDDAARTARELLAGLAGKLRLQP